MGQALYRKYRPRKFSEAVGQEAITKTLGEAVKSGRISHAYLFAGPRGVGKTSIARILAHQVNQLPYARDNFHLDIIEIDAASNRRIDEIRDLREKVHITPTSAKYKVYIIDEVHMLTKEAFNALLKTLEEPPAHCIFILATTEAHKLPETIISRTQRFNFKPITKNAAKDRLQEIAKQEKIQIGSEAIELLAEFGEGSLRDIIGLLDQLSAIGHKITDKDIRDLIGIPSLKALDGLTDSIADGNTQKALVVLDELKEQAATPASIARVLGQRLRQRILERRDDGTWLTSLLKELLAVSSSAVPQETLELAVLEAASANQTILNDRLEPPKSGSVKAKTRPIRAVAEPKPHKTQKNQAAFSLELWSDLLKRVKNEVPSLYAALRLAEPSIASDRLQLAFQFPLHLKKVQEAKHIKLIARIIEEISGAKPVIKCLVDKELAGRRNSQSPAKPTPIIDLKTINNIFGSAEVLES